MTDEFGRQLVEMMPQLKCWAMKLSRSVPAADDLTQDTITRALTYRDRFIPGSNLSAWLYVVMRNCWLQQIRRNCRMVATDPDSEIFGSLAIMPPQEIVIRLRETIGDIERLPACQRAAIIGAVEGRRMDESARALGVAEGTIKSRLNRARTSLENSAR